MGLEKIRPVVVGAHPLELQSVLDLMELSLDKWLGAIAVGMVLLMKFCLAFLCLLVVRNSDVTTLTRISRASLPLSLEHNQRGLSGINQIKIS